MIIESDYIYKEYGASKRKVKMYKILCNNCGSDRGYLLKTQDKRKTCNKCSHIGLFAIDSASIPSNCDPNDWVKNKDNIRKFRTRCLECGVDRGYQRTTVAGLCCTKCKAKKHGEARIGVPSKRKGIKTGRPSHNRGAFFNEIKKKLRDRVGRRLRHALKRRDMLKDGSTFSLLGYTGEQLAAHLESKFQPGMNWENAGKKSGVRCWHIDHIVPESHFNYTDINDENFKKCWSLENLQPLWEDQNVRKGAKLYWDK